MFVPPLPHLKSKATSIYPKAAVQRPTGDVRLLAVTRNLPIGFKTVSKQATTSAISSKTLQNEKKITSLASSSKTNPYSDPGVTVGVKVGDLESDSSLPGMPTSRPGSCYPSVQGSCKCKSCFQGSAKVLDLPWQLA
ncbi:hypothetical protein HDU80_001441 [Chytriomyces hyalinus]|nr:hypothetical protein HDU80_001441 [Chytriomyces hyalinus]